MKKIVFTLAALILSGTAMAQPGPSHNRPGANPHHVQAPRHHKKHKVWVPAHRQNGHLVRGHYVWR